jgi:subtilisin family serine protease
MRPRTIVPAAVSLVLVAAGVVWALPAGAETVTSVGGGEAGRTATLITGDRVTLAPDGGVGVAPGPGRGKVPMLTSTVAGHTRVVPADAVPLLRAGRLDPRLFDVTGLLADGYDDRRADLPVIASTGSGVTGTVMRRMTSLKASALHTRKRDLGRQWSTLKREGATGKVWLDAIGHFTGGEGVQQIGAPAAWQAGLTGKGLKVAVIDSGVDATHPDLAGRVAAQVDFTPVATGGAPASTDVHDLVGHGTEVASIAAGSGAASDGRYKGVAPEATIVSGKAGDWDVATSSVIAAMEWAAGTEHADVVNMSLGFPDAPGDDPVEAALNDLTSRFGTLFVVASGNDGDNGNDPNGAYDFGVSSPGTAGDALTVGAVDHDDKLAAFSSRGPRLGDNAVKPDLTAPGADETAARSVDVRGSGPYKNGLWGTSFAAPHVTGGAALLKQAHPDWTPAMLKSALMGTARPAAGVGVFAQGAGRVDVAAALTDPVLADPPSLNLSGTPTATLTYRNPGTAAQRLTLGVDGSFRPSTTSLTVPAGGSAQVTVTATGTTAGRLTATTAGGTRVTTPVGLVRTATTHRLTLHHVGADGQPTTDYYTTIVGLDTPYVYDSLYHYSHDYGSDTVVDVPEGRYAIVSQMFSDLPNETYVARPALTLDGDTELTIDERAGRPVRITVPRAGAVRTDSAVEIGVRDGGGRWVTVGGASNETIQMRTAQIGGDGDRAGFVSAIRAAYGDGNNASAYAYQLAYYQPGTLPTGFTKSADAARLAVDRTSARAQAPAGTAGLQAAPTVPGYPLTPVYTWAPLAADRYFNTDGGIGWTSQTFQYSDDGTDYDSVTTTGLPVTYEAGRTYTSAWNAPVVAPCPAAGGQWKNNQLTVRVGPYCDSAGHPGYVTQRGASGTTTLYRNGTEVASSDTPGHALFTAKPEAGTWRLTVDATRAASFGLSTHVTADWTFTDPDAAAHLPAVRMAPDLDAGGTAPAGRDLTMPITADAASVTLEVSSDDGSTWHPASVTRTGNCAFRATIQHPATPGYVSLRVHATGGTADVTETVVRAYRIA